MTFLEHLGEVRKRLIWSTIFLFIVSTVCFIFFERLLSGMLWFYNNGTDSKDAKLAVLGIADAFIVRIKVSFYSGLIISFPFFMWQLWRFTNSALTPKEKKVTSLFLVSSFLLFFTGVAIGLVTLPKAINFLVNVGGSNIEQVLVADKYVNFVLLMSFAFGLSFEMPVILVFLMMTRIVSPNWFKGKRRLMIVLIFIFAAVITPSQDPFSLLLMAVPLYVLFEISIFIGNLTNRKANS
jgi:sec-independent protein translocase protein TatC